MSVTVLHPTLARATWFPPKDLNGDRIYYEVNWQTEGTINGVRQKVEKTVTNDDVREVTGWHLTMIPLSSNETYSVWIRAYSRTNQTYTDSARVKIKTFPTPENVAVVNRTAYQMTLGWNQSDYVEHFLVQYTLLISSDWNEIREEFVEKSNGTALITVDGLKPKTQYKFRFLLTYPDYGEMYVWPSDSKFTFETLGEFQLEFYKFVIFQIS